MIKVTFILVNDLNSIQCHDCKHSNNAYLYDTTNTCICRFDGTLPKCYTNNNLSSSPIILNCLYKTTQYFHCIKLVMLAASVYSCLVLINDCENTFMVENYFMVTLFSGIYFLHLQNTTLWNK